MKYEIAALPENSYTGLRHVGVHASKAARAGFPEVRSATLAGKVNLRHSMRIPLRLSMLSTFAGTSLAMKANVKATLPPVSAGGITKPLDPPLLPDASGELVEARLIAVHTAFRHGARTPVDDLGSSDSTCVWKEEETDKAALLKESIGSIALFAHGSSDPIDPAVYWCGDNSGSRLMGGAHPGWLTKIGFAQSMELGRELRERYVDPTAAGSAEVRPRYLLPAGWERSRRLIETRSTRVERTAYTASGVLAGLFPGAKPDVEIELNGPPQDEWMVLNDASCPRLRQIFQQGLKLSSEGLTTAQQAVIRHVESGSNWVCPDLAWKLITYRDWFACRRAAGKPNPPAVEEVAAELDAATAKQMHQIFEGGSEFTPDPHATRTEALRLVIGRFMKHLVHGVSRPDGVLHLYSGHDWSVSPLLLCVTSPDDPVHGSWPPFCSNIAFEVWSTRVAERATPRVLSHPATHGDAAANDEGHFVRVLFNGSPVRLACPTVSGDHPGTCTLGEFKALVRPFCVADFAAEGQPSGGLEAQASGTGFNK